jgi:hypothetical protein
MSLRHRLRASLRRWHRRVGAGSAIVILLLTLSGILLNHAVDLGLDRRPVSTGWILDLYGIRIAPPETGFPVRAHWLSVAAGRVYFDAHEIQTIDQLTGVTEHDGVVLAAGRDMLLVLDADGGLLERLDRESLPGRLRWLGTGASGIVVGTPNGMFTADLSTLHWTETADSAVAVSKPAPLPPVLAQQIAVRARSLELNWERVLQDLHSGRLIGRYGPWIVDGFAVALLLLALSGFWLWMRSASHH